MKFMMLMIPAVYQGGKKVDPNFVPDPKKMEKMGRFNDEMGKALRIESLNGLHPQTTGARVSWPRQTHRDRWTLHRNQRSARRLLDGGGAVKRRSREMGAALPGRTR